MTDSHATQIPHHMKTKQSGARRERVLHSTTVQPPISRRILIMHARAITELVRIQHRQCCTPARSGA
jgi:hypothetical protein